MTALYLITPPTLTPTFTDDLAAALDAGLETSAQIACVQLRLKGVSDDDVLRAAEALLPQCAARGVGFLINDRADLAKSAGADGVHLGQSDGSVADARALLGQDADIGVTCHGSLHLAIEAGEAGADYVAFGAFFDTQTKTVDHRADIEVLAGWAQMTTVPCVAIGGISPANCQPLAAAGADFLAVSGSVWHDEGGPAAAIRAFASALD